MRLLKNLLVIWITFGVPHSDGFVYPNHLTARDENQFWINSVLKNVVEEHLTGCSVILIGNASDSSTENVIKLMSDQSFSHTLINLERGNSLFNASQNNIIEETLYATPFSKCLAIISDVTMDTTLQNALSVFETFKLQHWPDIKVIFFGPEGRKETIFSDYSLRNTKSLIFISPKESEQSEGMKNWPSNVYVYGRCFYCNLGNEQIIILDNLERENQFKISQNIFPEMPNDFQGHEFNIVALSWYPIASLLRLSPEPCSEAHLKDSLDARMLTEISRILNFKYKIRLPCDSQWGTDDGKGNWSGNVGTLQHNMADFTFLLSFYHSRLNVIDYSRVYTLEPVVFTALKPQPLPNSLALIRPFAGDIWCAIMASVLIASVLLWILLRLSPFKRDKQEKKNFVDTFFLTLSIIFLEPPIKPPKLNTGRMFLSWWWVYCMIVTIAYQSSLIAHLTFPSKSLALNYVSELVERRNEWKWGYEPLYGSGWTWFKDSLNPDISTIFKNFQILKFDEQMENVLQGNYAFFTYYFYIKTIIMSQYTNKFGFTPLYISQEKYLNYGGYGWGFRKGAPFRLKIDKIKHHLLEAGLIDYWLNDLIIIEAQRSRKKREKEQKDGKKSSLNQYQSDSSSLVVLGLDHMQGAFYLYAVGCGLAFASFMIEILLGKLQKVQQNPQLILE